MAGLLLDCNFCTTLVYNYGLYVQHASVCWQTLRSFASFVSGPCSPERPHDVQPHHIVCAVAGIVAALLFPVHMLASKLVFSKVWDALGIRKVSRKDSTSSAAIWLTARRSAHERRCSAFTAVASSFQVAKLKICIDNTQITTPLFHEARTSCRAVTLKRPKQDIAHWADPMLHIGSADMDSLRVRVGIL
jgi:hypothetical protein